MRDSKIWRFCVTFICSMSVGLMVSIFADVPQESMFASTACVGFVTFVMLAWLGILDDLDKK